MTPTWQDRTPAGEATYLHGERERAHFDAEMAREYPAPPKSLIWRYLRERAARDADRG
jgi:hypothetical protein